MGVAPFEHDGRLRPRRCSGRDRRAAYATQRPAQRGRRRERDIFLFASFAVIFGAHFDEDPFLRLADAAADHALVVDPTADDDLVLLARASRLASCSGRPGPATAPAKSRGPSTRFAVVAHRCELRRTSLTDAALCSAMCRGPGGSQDGDVACDGRTSMLHVLRRGASTDGGLRSVVFRGSSTSRPSKAVSYR